MMNREKITLEDSPMRAITKLALGNPGAAVCLAQVFEEGPTHDPESVWSGFGPLVTLESVGIYGDCIWVLYKICGKDVRRFVGVLRAVQLGLLDRSLLCTAIDSADRNPSERVDVLDIDSIIDRVREALPSFSAAPKAKAAQ